ncbi:hypothetical protein LTR94_032518, partial [Friedmanniomyces endolithicus]
SFAKTDLAKFEMAWEACPFLVSKGAQHTFAEYARLVGRRWEKDSDTVNELYFRSAVAKAIIFRGLEKRISDQQWYKDEGGYRAQLVAYTIAKLDQLIRARGLALDFDQVWKAQTIPSALASVLLDIAQTIRPAVTQPGSSVANVTEWAKKQACWARVQD